MASKPKTSKRNDNAITEFTITGYPKVTVVPTLDDLPRTARRQLRDSFKDSALYQHAVGGPRFEMLVEYARAYAATQGVNINLDTIEDDDAYDQVRQELVVIGGALMAHFNTQAGDTKNAKTLPMPTE